VSDLAKSLATLPSDSLRVIYDYMVDINRALNSFANATALGGLTGLKPVVKIDNLRTSSQPAGVNGVQVNIDGLTAVATISGSTLADNFSTGCAGGSPVVGSAPGLTLDQFFIMTVEERGAWYVDPLGTVAANLKVVVTRATPADVECLLRRSHDTAKQQAATKDACAKSTMFR
jgi:hypothetical protein